MEIILLEKIDNVGGIGDKVAVKPGYARNYLIPQGKATLATPENIAKFDARRSEIEAKAHTELEAAQARAGRIEGQVLRVRANASPGGKLFGSVGTPDIAEACKALGFDVERSEIRLAEGPLRFVGEHQIELHFHTGVNVPLTVVVEAQDGEAWVDVENQSETVEPSKSGESAGIEAEDAEDNSDT
jgi:large subunit ribosomal protein L9